MERPHRDRSGLVTAPNVLGLCAALFGTLGLLAASTPRSVVADGHAPPNVLLIVADDLGFSDLGSYGGEIATPRLDRLADEGLRFTDFYVAPTCSPTRSMLLTGLDNHLVGLGNMYERTAPNQLEAAGHEGVLDTDVVTLADVFADQGYATYMAGKWHLGHSPAHIPAARGFERSFALLNGAGSHFDFTGANDQNERSEFVEDDDYLTRLPRGYYSTKTFTDKIIEYVDGGRTDGGGTEDRPFFAYLAFQAPHDPIQVPDDWLRRYTGVYDAGWDRLREERLARMRDIGIVPEGATLSPRLWYVPEWDDLTGVAQVQSARRMEVYASAVEYMDREIGRLLDHLDRIGELENTWVVFFSDNGPNPADPVAQAKQHKGRLLGANFYATDYRTHFASWGRKDGFVAQSAPWAQVSATPFSGVKLSTFEGGIRSPLIVWAPDIARAGVIESRQIVHVADIGPTLLDLAGVHDPARFPGAAEGVQSGRSQRAHIVGDGDAAADARGIGLELMGARAYREGRWKLVWMHAPYGEDRWQLFDLAGDPAETLDLSDRHPGVRERLVEAWRDYATANGVTLPDRTVYDGLEENLPPRPPVDAPDWPRGQEPNWAGEEDDERD